MDLKVIFYCFSLLGFLFQFYSLFVCFFFTIAVFLVSEFPHIGIQRATERNKQKIVRTHACLIEKKKKKKGLRQPKKAVVNVIF